MMEIKKAKKGGMVFKIENGSPVLLLQGIELLLALGEMVTYPPELLSDHSLERENYKLILLPTRFFVYFYLGSAPICEIEDVFFLPFPQRRRKHCGTCCESHGPCPLLGQVV